MTTGVIIFEIDLASAREEFYKFGASREEFVLLGIVLQLLGGVRCK